ncbi:MAG TPA: ABC transporter ATP-binding protein [Vicinamibacterales bacterium]|nr:ABC transporter ATP-binding protein [Vicinamibacterales bacterium]
MLWADNVSFRYAAGAPLVVDGVTVRLTDGALAGILGPNGSGKTTLLRLLSGTRRPTSGRVLLGERPLDQLSRREAARQIAVVPQETELAFEYRAIEIVLMGRHPHLGVFTVEGPDDIRIAQEALASTGTSHLAERMFHELSGGEKQRIVIAAALAQSADLLLLDEPTASLDLGYQLEISSLLLRLNQEQGVTMAISTHDLNLAASICRELILVRDGRVLAAGPTADVLTPENVMLLYDVEADVRINSETGHVTVVPVRLAAPKRIREGGRISRSSSGSGR